jgi:anti-sigma B factor antagonist
MSELPVTEDARGLVRVWRERTADGGVIVHAAGEIDLVTAPRLTAQLATAEAELSPSGPLVLNLTEVTFLASVGLSVLVACHERCLETSVELRIVTGNRTVARSILMTGLTDMLPTFGTLADALSTTA